MRHKHIVIGVLAAMALTSAPHAAFAQPPEPIVQLRLLPTGRGIVPGGEIKIVASNCLGGPEGPATSAGFTSGAQLSSSGDNEYTGTATLVPVEGTYQVFLRCKGTPGFVDATFTMSYPLVDGWILTPEIQPGGTIAVFRAPGLRDLCPLEVTSPGFVAPIKLGDAGKLGARGTGQAIMTPGTYQATMMCQPKPLVKSFTILGDPPTTPPVPNPKPQVPVKPKGAPETGDGSTA